MIYEYPPNLTVRSVFTRSPITGPASSFALTSSAQTAKLVTCRTINIQARAIMTQKRQTLLDGPGRKLPFAQIEADCEALLALSSGYSVFEAIKDYYGLIREERTNPADFDTIFSKAEAYMVENLGLYQSEGGQDLIPEYETLPELRVGHSLITLAASLPTSHTLYTTNTCPMITSISTTPGSSSHCKSALRIRRLW
jgi:hypothetical protein